MPNCLQGINCECPVMRALFQGLNIPQRQTSKGDSAGHQRIFQRHAGSPSLMVGYRNWIFRRSSMRLLSTIFDSVT